MFLQLPRHQILIIKLPVHQNRFWIRSRDFESTTFVASQGGLVGGGDAQSGDQRASLASPVATVVDEGAGDSVSAPCGEDVYAPDVGVVFSFGRCVEADARHADQVFGLEREMDDGILAKIKVTSPVGVVRRFVDFVISRESLGVIAQGLQAQRAEGGHIVYARGADIHVTAGGVQDGRHGYYSQRNLASASASNGSNDSACGA